MSTRTSAVWFATRPSSTSVSAASSRVAAQHAPDGHLLAADRANGVENFLFEDQGQRVELNQVDHGAGRCERAAQLGVRWQSGRRWRGGRRADRGRWRGRHERLRRASIPAGVEVIPGNRLRGQ
jgi:hypothetical protein